MQGFELLIIPVFWGVLPHSGSNLPGRLGGWGGGGGGVQVTPLSPNPQSTLKPSVPQTFLAWLFCTVPTSWVWSVLSPQNPKPVEGVFRVSGLGFGV